MADRYRRHAAPRDGRHVDRRRICPRRRPNGRRRRWVALRRDGREERTQAITEAGETIKLLKEQTDILKDHGEKREADWRRRETSWQRAEARLEDRIKIVEGNYHSLVQTITAMGLCANAPTCTNYNPGDRRRNELPRKLLRDEGVAG
jgi:hypothetical protein